MEAILFIVGVVVVIGLLIWGSFLVEITYDNKKKVNAVMDHLGLELGDSFRLEYKDREDE